MSFGRTNSLSVIGATHLDLATLLRSFARDSLPKNGYPQKGDMCHRRIPGIFSGVTLPETNIAPGNGWSEDEFPFGMAYFHGLC